MDYGPLLTLTTDFGTGSAYVAQLKGVLLAALPWARIVDVAHDIPPQSIRHAETLLRSTAFAFPAGTVNLVVVDPGVGTARRPIAVQTEGCFFVGPDNGVLGVVLRRPQARTVVLDRSGLFRQPVAPTFHGRDIFAPVAAALASGTPLEAVGTRITDPLPSTLPEPEIEEHRVLGETLMADTFGNLLTNIPSTEVPDTWHVRVAGQAAERVRTYGEGERGQLLALHGSDGFLEIAVRDGAAGRFLHRDAGVEIVCEPA